MAYSIYLRAGLIEYLSERCPKAVEWFEKAKPFAPPRDFVVVHGTIPTGIEKLIELARAGKYITPDEARKGDPTARLILMLADVYHEGQEHAKSLELCSRFLSAPSPKASREQQSYAYFRRARNHYLIAGPAFDPDAALADYVAAVRTASKAPWADHAMFLAGNIQWNDKQNLEAAVYAWRRLIQDYPDSTRADRCALFIGAAYLHSKKYPQAQEALEKYLTNYPSSEFTQSARQLLEECKTKMPELRERKEKPDTRK